MLSEIPQPSTGLFFGLTLKLLVFFSKSPLDKKHSFYSQLGIASLECLCHQLNSGSQRDIITSTQQAHFYPLDQRDFSWRMWIAACWDGTFGSVRVPSTGHMGNCCNMARPSKGSREQQGSQGQESMWRNLWTHSLLPAHPSSYQHYQIYKQRSQKKFSSGLTGWNTNTSRG